MELVTEENAKNLIPTPHYHYDAVGLGLLNAKDLPVGERFMALAKRISYKPDVNIDFFVMPPSRLPPDVNHGHAMAAIQSHIPAFDAEKKCSHKGEVEAIGLVCLNKISRMTDHQVFQWFKACISEAERHESDEWFKVDGETFKRPVHRTEQKPKGLISSIGQLLLSRILKPTH